MELTCALSSTPESASSVTVAGCASLILEMSDSLKATVIVIEPVLTISMRPEPLDDEVELLDPPRLPALDPDPDPDPALALALDPDPLDPDPEFALAPLPDTVSPGGTSATLNSRARLLSGEWDL
jgi:hypothetical protein